MTNRQSTVGEVLGRAAKCRYRFVSLLIMNHIPNIITSVRFIAALLILSFCFICPEYCRHAFLALFVAAGISDMLDGFVARRFHWCTEFGAKFDSISDLSLYAAVGLFLWNNAPQQLERVQTLLLIGALIQIFHLALAMFKHRQFPSYHTTLSRACAYFIFFGIVGFWSTGSSFVFPLLVISWTMCSIEGIIITLILRKPAINLKGIRSAIQINDVPC
jgi:phosphatidylglycerophosphate synthase